MLILLGSLFKYNQIDVHELQARFALLKLDVLVTWCLIQSVTVAVSSI